MGKKEEITNALKEAMKNGDSLRKQTIRMILSNIKNAEIDTRKELDDSEIISILFKEVKIRQDSIAEAEKGGREDIIQANSDELKIVESFLPKPFSEKELRELVSQTIEELGADSKKQIGAVMKLLIPRLNGRASSSDASKIVQEMLG